MEVSGSPNRIASLILRVLPSSMKELEDFYTQKLGFQQDGTFENSSNMKVFSVPQCLYPETGHASASLVLNPIAMSNYSPKKSDIYWKIGLAVHDVDEAATFMGYDPGSQFRDIGYLKHICDPSSFPIELLQTTFETNISEKESLFGAK